MCLSIVQVLLSIYKVDFRHGFHHKSGVNGKKPCIVGAGLRLWPSPALSQSPICGGTFDVGLQKKQLSQGKELGMLPYKRCFQKSLGIRRTGHFASDALAMIVILVILQLVLPAYPANAQTARLSAILSYGCISPSDCVSKM